MKKQVFTGLAVGLMLLALPSCKKEFTCQCKAFSGVVTWQGSVEAVSKSAAEKIVSQDCQGETVSCN